MAIILSAGAKLADFAEDSANQKYLARRAVEVITQRGASSEKSTSGEGAVATFYQGKELLLLCKVIVN